MSTCPGQVVCFETFRRERGGERPMQPAPKSPFRAAGLTPRAVDHRRRMLRYLAVSVEADLKVGPYESTIQYETTTR
jgi:hypothetical protein